MYNFNYGDPYFTPDGVSRGFSMYYTASDYARYNITPFSTNTYGAKVNFGYPISDIERVGLDFGLRNLEVVPTQYSSQEIIRTPVFDKHLQETIPEAPRWNDQIGFVTFQQNQELSDRFAAGLDSPRGTFESQAINESMLGDPGFLDIYGNTFNDAQMSVYWLRSTLNRGILADRGSSQRSTFEISLPGGDLQYYKFSYDGQIFLPLTRALTLRLHTELGYAAAYGNVDELPFFEHYYAGGFGSVRGFERNTLGPRSTSGRSPVVVSTTWDDLNADGIPHQGEVRDAAYVLCDDPDAVGIGISPSGNYRECELGKLMTDITGTSSVGRTRGAFGGNVLIEAGAEILFPLPFIKDQRSVQTVFFVDAGNVFDTDCGAGQLNCYDVDLKRLSSSVGLGLTWISGFGPMTFSLSKPLHKNEFDRDDPGFEFSLGQTF
jgi:outer membrane protein insertion porin family